MNIIQVKSLDEIYEVKKLFKEYETYLNVELDIDINFQNFESELEQLPGKYAPPSGTLLMSYGRTTSCILWSLAQIWPYRKANL